MCEGGELFPTREPVDPPRFAKQRIEAPLQDVTDFPGARTRCGEGGGEAVPVPFGRGQSGTQHAALEKPAPELLGRRPAPGRPELENHGQVLVDLSLSLQLELRYLSALLRPVRDVEKVR